MEHVSSYQHYFLLRYLNFVIIFVYLIHTKEFQPYGYDGMLVAVIVVVAALVASYSRLAFLPFLDASVLCLKPDINREDTPISCFVIILYWLYLYTLLTINIFRSFCLVWCMVVSRLWCRVCLWRRSCIRFGSLRYR